MVVPHTAGERGHVQVPLPSQPAGVPVPGGALECTEGHALGSTTWKQPRRPGADAERITLTVQTTEQMQQHP